MGMHRQALDVIQNPVPNKSILEKADDGVLKKRKKREQGQVIDDDIIMSSDGECSLTSSSEEDFIKVRENGEERKKSNGFNDRDYLLKRT